jgi:hypothetical protein
LDPCGSGSGSGSTSTTLLLFISFCSFRKESQKESVEFYIFWKGIYKEGYLKELFKKYGDEEDAPAPPELPDWCYEVLTYRCSCNKCSGSVSFWQGAESSATFPKVTDPYPDPDDPERCKKLTETAKWGPKSTGTAPDPEHCLQHLISKTYPVPVVKFFYMN